MISAAIGARELERIAKKLGVARGKAERERSRLAAALAKGIRDLALARILKTKTDPDGVPWLPWSRSYAATRSAHHSLLRDTRKLEKGFIAYSSPSGKLVKVSNKVPYAGYVQAKRRFLGIGKQENRLADELALRYFKRVMA